ncbi:hypothetical protein MSAN_02318500 [Mycena sanguinolenta]|uniref:Uncharacterized protein n=1 Tax=Mycena sanguinolenta TaxID=230812 RepID=A0A8H6X7U8_9AGAR|nr:hypothetical protein MSAN_02318500 [Mycena sanguinolenta]
MSATNSAAISQELPDDLKRWLEECHTVPSLPQNITPLPPKTRVDWVPAPPVPDHLRDQECVYGYKVFDTFMRAYLQTIPVHKPPPPVDHYLWFSYKRLYLQRVMDRIGLELFIEHKSCLPEDIVYFACTVKGRIQFGIPPREQLRLFEKELGLTEPPGWHDSGIAWRDIRYRY